MPAKIRIDIESFILLPPKYLAYRFADAISVYLFPSLAGSESQMATATLMIWEDTLHRVWSASSLDEPTYQWMKELARKEGVFAGPSTGANLAAVQSILSRKSQMRILTLAYDRGEKYISLLSE